MDTSRAITRFTTFDEVLRAIPGLVASQLDVHDYLQRPGVLAEELRAEMQRAAPATEAIRASRPGGAGTRLPTIVRDVKPRPAAALTLPRGEYDLRVALRIELVNQTLAGLYQAHTITHRFPLGPYLTPVFDPVELRTVMTGIPDAVTAEDFQITAAPSGEVVDFVEHLVVALPFRVDFVRRRLGPVPRPPVVVAYLSGTLRLMVEMKIAVVTAEGIEGAVLEFPVVSPPPLPGGARLVIDSDSPVQAILPGLVDDYFLDRDGYLRGGISLAFPDGMALGSPVIAIPGLDGISLKLQRGDVRASVDTVNIGLLLGVGDDLEEPETGDPTTLKGSPIDGNIRAIAHATVVDKLMRAARLKGRLQAAADQAAEFQPGMSAFVTDAWGSIDGDGIKVRIGLSVGGVCATNLDVVYALDLKPTVENGQIVVIRHEEWQGIYDWDLLYCFLSGVATFGTWLVIPLLRVLLVGTDRALNGFPSEDPAPFVVSALLETTSPVPGTELRAQVQVTTVDLSSEKMEMTSMGTAALLRDTLNAYVYAIFHEAPSDPLNPANWPIANAIISLVDQDWPPVGDELPTVPVVENQNTIVTTEVLQLFEPAGALPQWIAKSKTNVEGRARFVLSPQGMVTRWGTALVRRTYTNRETGATFTTRPFVAPIDEVAPDLYFVVERAEGGVLGTPVVSVDVRRGQRVGTADEPLRFQFGGPVISPG